MPRKSMKQRQNTKAASQTPRKKKPGANPGKSKADCPCKNRRGGNG